MWRANAPTNSEVMITDIVDQQTLHVCPVDKCGVYRKLFQKLAGTIPAYTKTPKALEIVLATGKSGATYRAQIQTIVSAVLGHVIDVDSGALEELEFKHMAPASDFVKALPIYLMKVKVAGVDQFPIEDRILVAEYWQSVVDGKKTLILSYEGALQMGGVRLLNATTKKNFLMDVQDIKVAKLTQVEKTPIKAVKRFMLAELELREISVGEQVKVSLIDVSAVDQGLLTVCEFHQDNVMLYDKITKAVNDYGKSQAAGDAYYPK
jgi:Tudor domain